MRPEDEKAEKNSAETWKAEKRAGKENSPVLAELILLSSRAPAEAG